MGIALAQENVQECPSGQGLGGACSALLPSCGSRAALALPEEPLMWAQLGRLLHMFSQSQSQPGFLFLVL